MSFDDVMSQRLKRELEDKQIYEGFVKYKISRRKSLSKEKLRRFNLRIDEFKKAQKEIRTPHTKVEDEIPDFGYQRNLDALRLEAQINSTIRMIADEETSCFLELTQLQTKLLNVQAEIKGLKASLNYENGSEAD